MSPTRGDSPTIANYAMTNTPNTKLQRLFGAADLLLRAMGSPQGMNSLIPIHLDVPRPVAMAPVRPYTLTELVDAMIMLVRMGFLPVQQSVEAAKQEGGQSGHPLKHAQQKSQTESNDERPRRRSGAGLPRAQRQQAIRMKHAFNATMN